MNAFLAILGVIGVSASGPIMAATSAPALAIAFWRNAAGSVVMGVPSVLTQHRQFRRLRWAELKWAALAALALAFHFACFITALKLTSVAAATALVCLQAAWIALFELLRGIKLSRFLMAGLGLSLIGVLVITGFDFEVSAKALTGDALGLAGGALAAIYTLAGSRARRSMSTGIYTTLCYGMCAVILVLLCLAFREPLTGFSPQAWLGILAVTVVAQIMGHTIFNHLLASMSPLVVSMLILLEIPGAAILAGVFLHQLLPTATFTGLTIILAGLAVVVFSQGRRKPYTSAPSVPS